MTRLRGLLLLGVVAGLLDACSPCNGDTIFITVLFPDFALGADQVAIDVGVNGMTSRNGMAMAPHNGEASGSFEARIANYAAGDKAYITVSALSHGQIIVTSNKTIALVDGCTTVTIDLAQSDVGVRTEAKNKVDLLFMIDDSPSMKPKQDELRARFPNLVKILDDARKQGNPAWYHIGVVTSDLGAAQEIVNRGQCKPGGKGGKLQPIGAGAPTTCQGPVGANYIDYNQLQLTAGAPQSNLPGDHSINDLATTFGCMAAVGDQGCGFEHQLEAVYRAVHDVPPENQGFFRSDASLVVLFVTDEDDCSADANSDLFSAAKIAEYGLQNSYRCTRYGVYGDIPSTGSGLMPYGDSGGLVSNARPATAADGGKLLPVQRYIDFFTQPKSRGGAKINPADVLLAGITGDPSQVASILANITLQTGDYQQCPGPISNSCAPVLKHSCANSTITDWFADPPVRINSVINATQNHVVNSVCDSSFQGSLQSLGGAITAQMTAVGCLLAAPAPAPAGSTADPCVVADLAYVDNTSTPIPRCGAGAPMPCWDLVSNANCPAVCAADGTPAQHLQVSVNRGGALPPANTIVTVTCTLLTHNLLGPGPTCF